MAVNQIHVDNGRFNNIVKWGKLITLTSSAQIVVQGIGLISGIIIIRLLPTQEYALYTLVNTMLGTMTILADGGIGAGVMAQGGTVWQDKEKLGAVVATGLNLRKKFAVGSLLIVLPILLYLLLHNGATWLKAILIIATLIPAFIAALSDSLLEIVPKLRQEIKALQKNQIWVAFVRLLFILPMYFSPFAAIAIIASGIPRIMGNIKLRKLIMKSVDLNQKVDPVVQKKILTGVKKILPGSIYYCVSGQITIWIISLVGNSNSVAQVGALSRLAMILNIVSVLFNTLITPRFARLPELKSTLFKKLFFSLLAITCPFLLIILITALIPQPILWLLGKGYNNLSAELLLTVIGSCLSLEAGLIFSLVSSRGWILNPIILIGSNLLAIVIGCFIFPITTLHGVLLFNIMVAGIPALLWLAFALVKINSL